MPSEKPTRRLEDIIENAQAILRYAAGMDFPAFEKDTRPLTLSSPACSGFSEAVAKLGDLARVLVPAQPWEKIRALGNRLRHDYDAIRQDRLWDIVQDDLPSLCAACKDALRRLRER